MNDQRHAATAIERKAFSLRDVAGWAWAIITPIAAAGFSIAWSHEGRINRVETVVEEHQKTDAIKDARLRDDLSEIKSAIRAMSDKIDRLQERR